MSKLRNMIETRDKLVKMRTHLKSKIHAIMSWYEIKTKKEEFTSLEKGMERALGYEISESARFEIKIIIEQIELLNEGIRKIEEEIKRRGEKLKGQEQLHSIKGIMKLGSSAIILASIKDIRDFKDEKKLMAYSGLVPTIRESGDKQYGGRTTRRGDKILNTILAQLRFIVLRYSEGIRSFYLSVKKRRGSEKAIIAVARKLLEVTYHLLKTGEKYKEMGTRGRDSVEICT